MYSFQTNIKRLYKIKSKLANQFFNKNQNHNKCKPFSLHLFSCFFMKTPAMLQKVLHNPKQQRSHRMKSKTCIFDMLAWILVIIGGLNWGLIGFFKFDIVAYLFG